MKALEIELTRLAVFWAALELVALLIGLWLLYLVIKSAIRDGINESRLGDSWTRAVERERHTAPDTRPMRVD